MRAIRLLLLGLALAFGPAIALAAPGYGIQVVFTGTNYRPVAINNAGDIAFVDLGPTLTQGHASVRYADGTQVSLNLPGSTLSYVHAINERGQAVGWSLNTTENIPHPVLLSGGQLTQLDANGGPLWDAYDINNAGHIAGQYKGPDGLHAVIVDGTSYHDLGSGGAAMSSAAHINDHDQVVGINSPFENATHAFYYSDGVMTDLSVLSGHPNTSAWGINELGQMIGRYNPPSTDQQEHGFLYYQGQFTELTPGLFSQPMAINNKGQIVGDLGNGIGDPFIWENGAYTHLNDLIDPASGYALQFAPDINDKGQILVWACNKQDANACDVLVLTPVPEAPGWLMLAAGVGLLALRGRLRQAASACARLLRACPSNRAWSAAVR